MTHTVTKEQREEILRYGREHGISPACRKFHISRTIYYRWKKRFDESGTEGLKTRVRSFSPVNKLDRRVEEILFTKVAEHPDYGPLSLKWLLEDDGINVSASGVYNILRRHSISKRIEREAFSRRYKKKRALPRDYKAAVGEIWLSWTEEIKGLPGEQSLFLYCLMDVASGISCSRLYTENSTSQALDLLYGLAIPMGKAMMIHPEIIITPRDKVFTSSRPRGTHPYRNALKSLNVRQILWDIDFQDYRELAEAFSSGCRRSIQENGSKELKDLRLTLQEYLRDFNLKTPLAIGPGKGKSPLENIQSRYKKKINLPLWAYLDREY